MQIGRIKGATRVLGKAQGYMGLPVRDEVRASGAPAMVTAWLPTPKELAALNAGAAVHVCILGNVHPPILVDVGEPPDETLPQAPPVPK
jgi:hypothetical protein